MAHNQQDQPFNRPPRIRPQWTPTNLELPTPPEPPRPADRSMWFSAGMPLVGVVLLAITLVFVNSGGNFLALILPMIVMGVVGVVTTILSIREQRRSGEAEFAEARRFFEERLAATSRQAHNLYDEERQARLALSPTSDELLRMIGARGADASISPRLWERRLTDDDFLDLRVGVGSLPSSVAVRMPPPTRSTALDRKLHDLEQEIAMQHDVPITIPIARLGSLSIAGASPDVVHLAHALIWHAVVLHSPDDLRIAAVVQADGNEQWDWLRWLPHTMPLSNERNRSLRMCASDDDNIRRLMSLLLDQLSSRRDQLDNHKEEPPPRFAQLLVLVDDLARVRDQPVLSEIMRQGPALGMAVVFFVNTWEQTPAECAAMLRIDGREAYWVRAGQDWPRVAFAPDATDPGMSDRLARKMAGIQLAETGSQRDLPRNVRLFDLFNITHEQQLNPPHAWSAPLDQAWRPDVPIGALSEDEPLYLNLNETSHGPHGVIAGTTGAGKSVLLQGIIAALAMSHSPVRLQLLLIDFKGGASLAMFKDLPHVTGFVTDLEGRLAERAMTAIKSEIRFRKSVLKRTAAELKVKKLENITDYRAQAERHKLSPLPNLLIVIDEFDELVTTYREFVTELVRVVKQGRSLGVQLLVATQQPEKAVTDEISTQLKFFIALRLGSSEDSRKMILKSDAAFLPTDIPGRAYFRVGSNSQLFQVALVTGEFRAADGKLNRREPEVIFLDHQQSNDEATRTIRRRNTSDEQTRTDLDVLVSQLVVAGQVAIREEESRTSWTPRAIWQPPLPPRLGLHDIAPTIAIDIPGQQPGVWLAPAIARLDIPQESRQETLHLQLSASHLAIVGAPGSGKTMLLRTLLLSLALTHSVEDLWCYVIDAGGQGLSMLAGLPQVGAVIQVRERERILRLLRMLTDMVRERQEQFRNAGASDLAAYRVNHECLPAIVVFIDKIALLREEFKDDYSDSSILDRLAAVARTSAAYGIHIVITADRVADMGYKLFSLMDLRISLRLPELFDYNEVIGGRVTSQIAATLPGRGFWMHPEFGVVDLHAALPLLETPSVTDGEDESAAQAAVLDSELLADLRETVTTIRRRWEALPEEQRVTPRPVELLSDQITLASLGAVTLARRPLVAELRAPLGHESIQHGVAELVLNSDSPHALVVGNRRSGKTTALHTIILGLASRYNPENLQIVLIDGPRRSLRALWGIEHVERYAQTEDEVRALAGILSELRASDMHYLVVIDDYPLCCSHMESQFKERFTEVPNLYSVLKRLASGTEQNRVHLLIGGNLGYLDDEVLRALDGSRNGLIMWPGRYDSGTKFLGCSLPLPDQRDADQPSGRALLVSEDVNTIVQVAHVPDLAETAGQFSKGLIHGAV